MGCGSTTKGPIPNRGGYDADNKGYAKDDIAALMGFAGVYNDRNLPDIWELFNATKGKNIDVYCRHLFAQMKQWVYNCRIQIDTSVYLELERIKDIVELRFNPGEGVAHLALASKRALHSCLPGMHNTRDRKGPQTGTGTVSHQEDTSTGRPPSPLYGYHLSPSR